MLLASVLFLVLVLVCVVIRKRGLRKRDQEQRDMAQYIRREVNSTAGWKEHQ